MSFTGHVVVLDFEATCDAGPPPSPQEIIEFPSVLLSPSLEVVDEFEAFVRPVHNPRLTRFCTRLTSITQEQVDAAEPFPEVLARYLAWLAGHGITEPDQALIATCGDWDLRRMFPAQLRASGLDTVPPLFRRWMNAKHPFVECFPEARRTGMVGMLEALDLPLEGHHHRGIDDSRNLAEVVRELGQRGHAPRVTASLGAASYPPIQLVLDRDGLRRGVTLSRRTRRTLLGLASEQFGTRVNRVFSDGRPISEDADLFDLRSGAVLSLY
ncbi:MAG: exonuclease domain-containing protein [Deltaproteobacteria bacterium]|nr:MAG: exonuclease domain-containing protein [Deltaproteobacteria bacterium]